MRCSTVILAIVASLRDGPSSPRGRLLCRHDEYRTVADKKRGNESNDAHEPDVTPRSAHLARDHEPNRAEVGR